MAQNQSNGQEYWKRNTRLLALLLFIWALVSYGFAIFFAEAMSSFKIGALPGGFWWAQQGAMFVFVILIFVYARRMDKLDREYNVHEEDD